MSACGHTVWVQGQCQQRCDNRHSYAVTYWCCTSSWQPKLTSKQVCPRCHEYCRCDNTHQRDTKCYKKLDPTLIRLYWQNRYQPTSRKILAGKSVDKLKVTMSCSTVTFVNCMSTRLSPDDSSNEIRCNYCTLESLTQRLFTKLLFLVLSIWCCQSS